MLKKNELSIFKNEYKNNNPTPGEIIGIIENEGIIITTKTEPILLLEAKLEGKNISKNNQLIQQLNPSVGERLSN